MSGALTDVLREQLAPEAAPEVSHPEIAGLLDEAVRAGTSAWPAVKLDSAAFVGRIAYHFSREESLAAWLRRVRAADLYLASACADRVPGAIDVFDQAFLGSIPAILARGGLRDVQADEVRQRVRERLFVGACKIAEYSGRGALSSWLQVVTLRIAIDAGREQRAQPIPDSPQVEDTRLAGTDLEIELIKERYREPFKRALRAAIGGLTSEQRNLLKLHFVDGMTLDALASLFHVHRATIARRIAQAREATFDDVRARLHAELGLDHEEFEALLGLVRSRLELSLSALLPSVVS